MKFFFFVIRFPVLFLLATLFFGASCSKAELPQSEGVVSDFVGVIGAEDKARMESLIEAAERETGAEIAVATVERYTPYDSIEAYAEALFKHWGPGRTGVDDGVLLVLAVKDRDVRIEVGFGLEGVLTDAASGRILDEAVLPDFREDNFSGGLLKGVGAIAEAIASARGVDLSAPEPEPTAEAGAKAGAEAASPEEYETGIGQLVWGIFPVGAFLLIVLLALLPGIISDKVYLKKHEHYPAVRWYKRSNSSSGGGRSSGGSHRSGGGRSGGGGASRHF